MACILSATECTIYTQISVSAQTIINRKMIEVVESRLSIILNNYFTSDYIKVNATANFNATANSITIDQNSWEDFGFTNGDTIFIYSSYRNDGYVKIDSITDNVAIINSAYSIVNERFNNNLGNIVLFSLARFPVDVKMVAAEMVYYDADIRSKRAAGVKSHSLGPFSESYSDDSGSFGYPADLLSKLDSYKLVRMN